MSDIGAKRKMTFRVDPGLARALRQLPNQTAFVEAALRQALGQICPLCHGTGQTPDVHLAVTNLKNARRIDRVTAAQLRSLVRLGRALLATELEIAPGDPEDAELDFKLAREDEVLLAGRLRRGARASSLTH